MKLKVTSGGVPPGNYTATFAGVDPATHDKYGPGLRWKFTITAGPCAGKVASRVTGQSPSAKNGCGKILSGLLGRPLEVDEEIDPQEFVNRSYLVVVSAGETGTYVDAVIPTPGG
jgi:hypothetical protein